MFTGLHGAIPQKTAKFSSKILKCAAIIYVSNEQFHKWSQQTTGRVKLVLTVYCVSKYMVQHPESPIWCVPQVLLDINNWH
jgi:hypothetical protein